MYFTKISSSSAVHLPLFNPTFSQQGALPISDQECYYAFVPLPLYMRTGQEIKKQIKKKNYITLTTQCAGERASACVFINKLLSFASLQLAINDPLRTSAFAECKRVRAVEVIYRTANGKPCRWGQWFRSICGGRLSHVDCLWMATVVAHPPSMPFLRGLHLPRWSIVWLIMNIRTFNYTPVSFLFFLRQRKGS